jgi:hypothetical protein
MQVKCKTFGTILHVEGQTAAISVE